MLVVGGTGGVGSTSTLDTFEAVTALALSQPIPSGATGTLIAHHWPSSLLPVMTGALTARDYAINDKIGAGTTEDGGARQGNRRWAAGGGSGYDRYRDVRIRGWIGGWQCCHRRLGSIECELGHHRLGDLSLDLANILGGN